ncbi:hypothetical protein ACKWTF_009686 [Chironomus riparius]
MSPTFTEIFTIIKYVIFLIYRKQFFDAIEIIENLNQKWTILSQENSVIVENNKICSIASKTIISAYFVTSTFYDFKPIVVAFNDYWIQNTQPNYDFPFKSKSFYDTTKSPAYELTYLIQIYTTYFSAAFNLILEFFEK